MAVDSWFWNLKVWLSFFSFALTLATWSYTKCAASKTEFPINVSSSSVNFLSGCLQKSSGSLFLYLDSEPQPMLNIFAAVLVCIPADTALRANLSLQRREISIKNCEQTKEIVFTFLVLNQAARTLPVPPRCSNLLLLLFSCWFSHFPSTFHYKKSHFHIKNCKQTK